MTPTPDAPSSASAVVARAAATVPGWTPEDQLHYLYALAHITAPLGGDVLEVGSWCGRSTVVLATAVERSGTGYVHAVDLFPEREDWFDQDDGSHSFAVSVDGVRVEAHTLNTVWDEPYREVIRPMYEANGSLWDAFHASVAAFEVSDTVRPHRGTAESFARSAPPDLRVRLAFLDADHSYEAVMSDITVAEDFLLPNAWVAFDDAFASYKGVDEAIREKILRSGRYDSPIQFTRKLFAARYSG